MRTLGRTSSSSTAAGLNEGQEKQRVFEAVEEEDKDDEDDDGWQGFGSRNYKALTTDVEKFHKHCDPEGEFMTVWTA
ncbi:hypothetical protein J5N97_022544 [Dioscorea zingiberensis]|uniref:Uncharacterized protein n=1 Tax=Dioscorea zingiberensis TaxID=325984 RepID=A0A9D5CAP0_9LILI|nr:hypothetical protein J5N97_022544 [Dioscorea zingiberensis]